MIAAGTQGKYNEGFENHFRIKVVSDKKRLTVYKEYFMPALSKEAIQRIVDELQCGLRVFYHKKTFDLLFVPNMNLYPEMEEFWQEDLDKLETNAVEYEEIDPMPSSQGFRTMEDFAYEVGDKRLQQQLFDALNRKGPFSNFKFVIDRSGDFRQQWFDFKAMRYMEWVERQLPL